MLHFHKKYFKKNMKGIQIKAHPFLHTLYRNTMKALTFPNAANGETFYENWMNYSGEMIKLGVFFLIFFFGFFLFGNTTHKLHNT